MLRKAAHFRMTDVSQPVLVKAVKFRIDFTERHSVNDLVLIGPPNDNISFTLWRRDKVNIRCTREIRHTNDRIYQKYSLITKQGKGIKAQEEILIKAWYYVRVCAIAYFARSNTNENLMNDSCNSALSAKHTKQPYAYTAGRRRIFSRVGWY